MEKRKSPELEEIARKVLGESALEVYLWASGRAKDLNDVCLGDRFSMSDNYVRAVHNVSESKLEFYKICSQDSLLYGREEVRGLEARGHSPLNSLNIVAYGPAKCIERKGLIFKKEVERSPPLSDFVKNGGSRDAYFMKFVINADVFDSAGRQGQYPVLTIVTNRQVVEQVVGYLRQNPQQYESVVRAILPKDRFPKVNSGILSQMRVTGNLVLLDAEKVPRDSQETAVEKIERYGEKVAYR